MMAFQMYVRDGAGMRLATLESNGVVTTRYREEEIHYRVPPDRSLVEDVAAPHIWQFVIDRQVQGAPTFDAEVSEEMLGGVKILAPPSADRVDEGEETGVDDDDRDDDDDGDGDGDDICPLCADETTDGQCVNGDCDASEKCPACGRVLNHDGVCENVSCSLGESQRFLSTFPR